MSCQYYCEDRLFQKLDAAHDKLVKANDLFNKIVEAIEHLELCSVCESNMRGLTNLCVAIHEFQESIIEK